MYQDVVKFQVEMEMDPPGRPTLLGPTQLAFRLVYMLEELGEFSTAHLNHDMPKAADALVDLVYYVLGTAAQMGLPFDEIWRAVHEANMRKVPGQDKYGNTYGALKPEGWESPHLAIVEALRAAGVR